MTDYDLIIIGAGIHGAALARAASYDGYKVCVLEQYSQPAMATSRSSSKLIHGGLRYLESFQFALVRECLLERKFLLKNAPHLVKLLPFYIPVYKHNSRPGWLIFLGLSLYRLLGGGKFRKIPPSEWSQLDGINQTGLRSVYQYFDAQTDDQKLTHAVLADAINHGAEFKPAHKVTDISTQPDLISLQTDQPGTLRCKILINASGPWVNDVLSKITPKITPLPIDLVQGTHIIIPRQLNKGVYYIEASDKRVIFFIPWQQHCLVGTTETIFNQLAENCQPLTEEINYLLAVWNQTFNDDLKTADIIESFAGLRVLPESGDNAFRRNRDTILHNPNPKVISIVGGKLTAHRATAESVMKLVHQQLAGYKFTDTSDITLNT